MLTDADVRNAVARAIQFFADTREPHALLWLNVMHRKFGIEEFHFALDRFDALLPELTAEAPVLRTLRRIADADNPVNLDDWHKVTKYTDRILVSALYSDRVPLPESFDEVLVKCVDQGEYFATHALLAWTWIRENRVELALPDGFVDRMCQRVAAIVDADPGLVNDLKLEAAAFLCLARKASLVNLGFVQNVAAVQNADGGWGRLDTPNPANPDGSSWHSSVLALLLLLHIDFPQSA